MNIFTEFQKKWKKASLNVKRKEKALKEPRALTAEQAYIFALIACLNAFDYFMTLMSVQLTKITEGNPVMNGAINNGYMFFITKTIGMGFLMLYLFNQLRYAGKSYDLLRGMLMIIATVYILLVFHNIVQLKIIMAGG